jgi:hypothetical protein
VNRFRESQEEAELAYVHATSVEVDLERVRKYRQFVCRSLCRSYLFSSLYGEQLEAIAASIEDVRPSRARAASLSCARNADTCVPVSGGVLLEGARVPQGRGGI